VVAWKHKGDDQSHQYILSLKANIGNIAEIARILEVPRSTTQGYLRRAETWQNKTGYQLQPKPTGFQKIELPDRDMPVEDLIEHRKRNFIVRHEAETARKLIRVSITTQGPIGITHFGDPHIDDDGCDIVALERDMKVTKETEGLFAANLGDLQNNWIGRLARLWANQSTSSNQAWKLVEWMVTYVDWLYIVAGNHDAWSGSGDPVKWMMRLQSGVYEAHGARLDLQFPNRKHVRINARHDFHGHSMWNPVHGPMKAVQGGWRDHILTAGHKHTSFIGGPLKDPSSGLLSWAVRCAGYKVHDDYAAQEGLPDQNAFPACVTIIDPEYQDDDVRLVTVIPNVEEGAEFLKWKRKKWARRQNR